MDSDLRRMFENHIAESRMQAERAKKIADDDKMSDADRLVAALLADSATFMANMLTELIR